MWLNLGLLMNRLSYFIQKILKNNGFLSSLQLLKVAFFTILLSLFMSSSCNARVLTDIEIKNFILNGYNTKVNTNVPTNIQNNVLNANFSSWISLMQTNEGHYGVELSSSGQQAVLYIISGSASNLENYFPYYNGSSFLVNTNYIRTDYYSFTLASGNFGNKVNGSGWLFSNPRVWWYTDTNIKINSNNQTKNGTNLYTAPYSDPANAFDENWVSSEVWRFTPSWNESVTLSGDTTVDYRVVDPSYVYTLFGLLADSSLCTGAAYDILAYDKTNNVWESVYSWGEYFDSSDPISNYFSTGDIDGVQTSSIKVRSNLVIPDTIITFYFNKGNEIADLNNRLKQSFYIRGSHSVITSSDVIDYDSTFSDPNYYNEYQNNVDELVSMSFDDTINDINNNLNTSPNVDPIVNDYFGSSGEIASALGFTDYSGDNPYGNVFLNILDGLESVLLDTGAVTLSCTVHGQTFSFNSNDFQNNSPTLKLFTSATCIFLYVYAFYYLAFTYIRLLTTADLWGLKRSVQDTAMILIRWM